MSKPCPKTRALLLRLLIFQPASDAADMTSALLRATAALPWQRPRGSKHYPLCSCSSSVPASPAVLRPAFFSISTRIPPPALSSAAQPPRAGVPDPSSSSCSNIASNWPFVSSPLLRRSAFIHLSVRVHTPLSVLMLPSALGGRHYSWYGRNPFSYRRAPGCLIRPLRSRQRFHAASLAHFIRC